MAPRQVVVIRMVVPRCVAVAVVTGKGVEDVVVSRSAVEVDLAMVALAGRVVDDPRSWIVIASETYWIVIVLLIATATATACSTEIEIGILYGTEIVTVIWTGVIDLSAETSGKLVGQIVKIVTAPSSLGDGIALLAEPTIEAQLRRLLPPRLRSLLVQVRRHQIDCLNTTPPNNCNEKHLSSLDLRRRSFDVIVIDPSQPPSDSNLPKM